MKSVCDIISSDISDKIIDEIYHRENDKLESDFLAKIKVQITGGNVSIYFYDEIGIVINQIKIQILRHSMMKENDD